MYPFAILLLLGAVAWKAADLVYPRRDPRWVLTLVALALGVLFAEILQWDVFAAWGQDITADWLGVLFSGLIIGGVGGVFQSLARFFQALMEAEEAVVHSLEERRAA